MVLNIRIDFENTYKTLHLDHSTKTFKSIMRRGSLTRIIRGYFQPLSLPVKSGETSSLGKVIKTREQADFFMKMLRSLDPKKASS